MSGKQRTQNVGKTPNQGQVMGEAGRERPTKFVYPQGMRAVTIYKGPRDNYDEVLADFTDKDGKFGGDIAHETSKASIVCYPIENFLKHQKEAEDLATARVSRAAPVGDASITQNTVAAGEAASLEALLEGSGVTFDG